LSKTEFFLKIAEGEKNEAKVANGKNLK